jgi:serine/threonine protein kinase
VKNKHFTDKEILQIAANLALGLLDIHQKGAYHVSLNPAFVFISKEKNLSILKIADPGTSIFSSPEKFDLVKAS